MPDPARQAFCLGNRFLLQNHAGNQKDSAKGRQQKKQQKNTVKNLEEDALFQLVIDKAGRLKKAVEVEQQGGQQRRGNDGDVKNGRDSAQIEEKRGRADAFCDRPGEGDFLRAKHAGAENDLAVHRCGNDEKDKNQKEDQDSISGPVPEEKYEISARHGGMSRRVNKRIHQVAEAVDNQKEKKQG